jgi:hypothetical protein
MIPFVGDKYWLGTESIMQQKYFEKIRGDICTTVKKP